MAEIMFYLSVIKIINKLNPLLKKKRLSTQIPINGKCINKLLIIHFNRCMGVSVSACVHYRKRP